MAFHSRTRPSTLLVLVVLALTSVGCTHKYKLDDKPIDKWPQHERLGLSVLLVITPELEKYQVSKEMGGTTAVYPYGPSIASNAEAMVNRAFQKATVSHAADASTAGNASVDVVLTPKVVGGEQSLSVWAFDPVEVTLDLQWIATDPRGEVIGMTNVRGVAKHILGNAFSHNAEAKKRGRMLMTDLFGKSVIAITTSPELKRVRPRYSSAE